MRSLALLLLLATPALADEPTPYLSPMVRFDARLPYLAYISETRAWLDEAGATVIETVDRDDDGDVVTEYRFAKGRLVSAERIVMGYDETGRQVGREPEKLPTDRGGAQEAARFFRERARELRGKEPVGRLVEVEQGDVACYLTFMADDGDRFKERGIFDLCDAENSPMGERVFLTYGFEQIVAPRCQGNPDCGASETALLVIDMRPAPPFAPGGSGTLCLPGEEVIFSCPVAPKIVSVCGAKEGSDDPVQFRFGPVGASVPDIAAPTDRFAAVDAMAGENVPFAGGGGSWLRIYDTPFAYTVYSGIGKWGEGDEPVTRQGVVFERGGKQIAAIVCDEERSGSLGPDWFARERVTPMGDDFIFPD